MQLAFPMRFSAFDVLLGACSCPKVHIIIILEENRKEKTTPFGIGVMRSLVT